MLFSFQRCSDFSLGSLFLQRGKKEFSSAKAALFTRTSTGSRMRGRFYQAQGSSGSSIFQFPKVTSGIGLCVCSGFNSSAHSPASLMLRNG